MGRLFFFMTSYLRTQVVLKKTALFMQLFSNSSYSFIMLQFKPINDDVLLY